MFYTHVNRNTINSNRARQENNPPISVRKGKRGKAEMAFEVELPPGSRMIYDAHNHLLPCGARLVIVSEEKPVIIR